MQMGSGLSFLSADDGNINNENIIDNEDNETEEVFSSIHPPRIDPPPKHLNMRAWISAALDSLDNAPETDDVVGANIKNKKISSGAYLNCALKIAHSLASQLCKLEEEEKERRDNNGEEDMDDTAAQEHPSSVPAQGLLWAECITIHLKDASEDGEEEGEENDVDGEGRDEKFRTRESPENAEDDNGVDDDERNDDTNGDDFGGAFHPVDNDTPSVSYDGRKDSTGGNHRHRNNTNNNNNNRVVGGENKNETNYDVFGGGFHPVEDAPSHVYSTGSNQAGRGDDKGEDLIFDLLPEIFVGAQEIELDGEDDSRLDPEEAGTQSFRQEEGNNGGAPAVVDCFNTSRAELQLEEGPGDESSDQEGDKRMRIYYLGLIFFELFSGGESPIAKEELGNGPQSSDPPDFAHAMSILDAIGDDDELFGGMDMGLLDKSNHSKDDGCSSNKKSRNFQHVDGETSSRKHVRATDASSITVEPLKVLGLPSALCALIGNMIESRGDFSGDETYSCMEDVQKDLKFMLESPDVYLKDLDLDHLCKVGLQMDDRTATWYGRDAEFTSLKQVYRGSMLDQCDVAIICGQQGVGKSSLAKELAEYAKLGDEEQKIKGCIFLSGKFDKLKLSQPFSPIASAFNKYCEWLSSSDERNSVAEKVSSSLKLALGQEAYALAKVIPNLSNIIGAQPEVDESESDSVEDAQKRLRYLLSQFVEVISRSHDKPLVLFMDDLQWADSASIALLKQILLVFGSSSRCGNDQLFLLGCCSETEKDHDLWNMLHSIHDFGVNTTKIELDFLEKETVNLMISRKLNMLPRLTRTLAEIVYHKTKGNPFFVSQLMVELSKEGLLRPSLSRCRWVWDGEKIQERGLPDDVVSFLTATLNRLPSDVLSAMCSLSCFGSCSDRSLVGLEKELGLSLSDPLDHAVAEGFLKKKDGQFHFVDDRVKESAYSLMKPEERCLHHFNYGLALCSVAKRNDDDGLFLIAVGQINLGGPNAVTDAKEATAVANHNLLAGKKARGMSDFVSAYWFYDYGISYLKKGHWNTDYDLSLALYDGAALCAIIIGEHAGLSILTEQIMHFAKCIEDKLNIFDVSVRILLKRSNVSAAIDSSIEVLSNLGEDFPEEVTPDVVIHFIEETKEMLDGMTDEELINHKLMSDPNKLMTMKFLCTLSECLYIIRPSDQPVAVMKMVQQSLMHGMSPLSPLAFVSYGSFLAAMGNISEGYRFARIAKALLETVGSRGVAGAVICYSTQIMAYAEPVQSAIEFHVEGGKAAMKSGSMGYAMMNQVCYDTGSYWSGKKLGAVKSQLDRSMSLAKRNKHVVILMQLVPLYGSVSRMIGHPKSILSNSEADGDRGVDQMEKLGSDLWLDNPFHSKAHYFNKMYIGFMFRNYSDMKSAAEKYSNKAGAWIFVFSSSYQLFYEGLVSLWIGRNEEDNEWIAKGKNACRAIESLAETASKWNFEHKSMLLQAEEQYCDGNLEHAEPLYDSAVLSARQHHFLNEEALALELAGRFYLKTGRKKRSITYFSQAIEKYHEWEASAKAVILEKYMEELVAAS